MPRSFTRRDLLAAASAVAVASLLPGCASTRLSASSPPTRLPGRLANASSFLAAEGWEEFAWPKAKIPNADDGLSFTWPQAQPIDGEARFRFTLAEPANGSNLIQVSVAGSAKVVASVEVQSANTGQIVELTLSATDANAALKRGLNLRVLEKYNPLLFVSGAASKAGPPLALQPHLIVGAASDPVAELKDRLASMDTIQPFGLEEGCVTEAQWDLFRATGDERFRRAMEQHFAEFNGATGTEEYQHEQALRVLMRQGYALPFATLARHRPLHRKLDGIASFLTSNTRRQANGLIQEPGLMTTEEAYTVAYPLAVIGGIRNDRNLIQIAIDQLQIRRRGLVVGNNLCHRLRDDADFPEAEKGKNDSQGMAWWLLGLVRTLTELRPADRPPELTAELARSAAVARKAQLPTGIWPAFLDQPASSPDTAASAGIAAAIAIGTKQGLLPPDNLAVARKAYGGLKQSLTPDGYLAGSVQAGVASQPSSGQSIQPWATGLLGQLIAALQPGVERG